ncbi:helix-turn-helix domain-containing protein [Halobacteriales archaeon Cl-PHB]
MGLIAEYTLTNPILRETRQAVPNAEFVVEDEHLRTTEQSRLVIWARGSEADLERIEATAPTDPSVADFEVLSSLPERRLFAVRLAPEGEAGVTYGDAIAAGITLLDIGAQGTGVEYRAQVPDREALASYREACRDRDLGFELHRLYSIADEPTAAYGLTDRQRDVLRTALDRGYFEVPRSTTAEELARELDVSSQALSATVRRGISGLLRNTVAADLDT